MPTIAVSTYSFGPEGGARQGLDFAVRHGFRGLELGSWRFWPEVLSPEDVRYLRVHAASHGVDLSIHFIHRGVAPASHNPERRARHLKELEATLRLAHDIGARTIVLHPGPLDPPPTVAPTQAPEAVRREAIAHLADFLRRAAPLAEEAGAVVCVENLEHRPGYVIQGYQELVDLVREVDSPAVRLTLDFGHADLSDGVGPALQAFAPYLRHIHIHDSNGQRDHLEIGTGRLDFRQHLDALKAYPHTLAIESRDPHDEPGCVVRSGQRLRELLGDAAR